MSSASCKERCDIYEHCLCDVNTLGRTSGTCNGTIHFVTFYQLHIVTERGVGEEKLTKNYIRKRTSLVRDGEGISPDMVRESLGILFLKLSGNLGYIGIVIIDILLSCKLLIRENDYLDNHWNGMLLKLDQCPSIDSSVTLEIVSKPSK